MGLKIDKHIAQKWGLDTEWNISQYTLHNPTSEDVFFDFFNPNILEAIPDTPFGFGFGIYPKNLNTLLPTAKTRATTFDSNKNRFYFGDANTTTNYSIDVNADGSVDIGTAVTILGGGTLGATDMAFSPVSNKVICVSETNKVTFIDSLTQTVSSVFTILIPTAKCKRVAYNSIKNTFYVTSVDAFLVSRVFEFDAVTETLISTIVFPAVPNILHITYNPNNNFMYVSVGLNQIYKINCSSNLLILVSTVFSQVIDNVVCCIGNNSIYCISAFVTFEMYVAGENISLSTISIVSGNDVRYYSDSVNSLLYYVINSLPNNHISIVDCSNNTIVNNIPLAGNSNTNMLSVSTNTQKVFITWRFDNKVDYLAVSNFYITGSSSYNQDVRDSLNAPFWIRRILFYSQNQKDFNQIITHTIKDANGNEVDYPRIPSLSVGVQQFQSGIAQLDFTGHELVFGVNEWFSNLLIEAHSDISIILVYKQIDITSIFPKSVLLVNRVETYLDIPKQTFTDKDLEMSTDKTLFQENAFKDVDKKYSITPFDFEMMNLDFYEQMEVEKKAKSIKPVDLKEINKT